MEEIFFVTVDNKHRQDLVSFLTEHYGYYNGDIFIYHCNGHPSRINYQSVDDNHGVYRLSTIYWYRHGKLHRDDGPAKIIYSVSGHVCGDVWYRDGLKHRDYGPAESLNSDIKWYIRGIDLTEPINEWLVRHSYPGYKEWNDSERLLFKLVWH